MRISAVHIVCRSIRSAAIRAVRLTAYAISGRVMHDAYSRDPSMRYAVGPEPTTFGGKRALDFVLDNKTLKDFNRTLLFDIRLSNIRK